MNGQRRWETGPWPGRVSVYTLMEREPGPRWAVATLAHLLGVATNRTQSFFSWDKPGILASDWLEWLSSYWLW